MLYTILRPAHGGNRLYELSGKRYAPSFLQGTRPRYASGTLMSLRAIPLSFTVRRATHFLRSYGGTDQVFFPNRQAIIRLVGAVLAEQNDEWAEGRRYLSLDILTKSRLTPQPTQQEDTPLQLSA